MPRHQRRSATRPWSIDPPTGRSRSRLRRAVGALAGATTGALILALVLPLATAQGPARDLTGVGEAVDAAHPSASTAPSLVGQVPESPPAASPATPSGPTSRSGPEDRADVFGLAPRPAPPSELDGYVWPLPRGRLTLPFGPSPWGSRIVNGQAFHDGIDLATFCGDRIVAAHAGRVLAVGRQFDTFMGWRGSLARYTYRLERKHLWATLPIVVIIDDGNGYRSIYAHFSRTAVKVGQRVRAGQLIGYEGATGRASGCHLHYGLFSPSEPQAFRIEPAVAKRMLLPATQTARIDPLLVLPARPDPAASKPGSAVEPTGPASGPSHGDGVPGPAEGQSIFR